MKQFYLIIRCVILWILSAIHFFTVCTALVILGIFFDPRTNDWPQRWFFRNILRVAGVGFKVRRSPGFDPQRTSIFICNHINIFDAFVIYSAIPQFVRGLELESHFKVPAYGWMMKRFGNIPVTKAGGPSQFKKTLEHVKFMLGEALVSLFLLKGQERVMVELARSRKVAL